jgi:3-oxocholest-4-en-26-oate---CoA ligase
VPPASPRPWRLDELVPAVLLACPGVTDAAVVGVPTKPGANAWWPWSRPRARALTEGELRDAVRHRLAGYKAPRAVILLPALPRTPVGKLELAAVRRIAAANAPGDPPSRDPS